MVSAQHSQLYKLRVSLGQAERAWCDAREPHVPLLRYQSPR
jgi:hypothetical protein